MAGSEGEGIDKKDLAFFAKRWRFIGDIAVARRRSAGANKRENHADQDDHDPDSPGSKP